MIIEITISTGVLEVPLTESRPFGRDTISFKLGRVRFEVLGEVQGSMFSRWLSKQVWGSAAESGLD